MAAVIQRPLRGSRVSTFYPVKNLPSLSSLDSAFQLQEYISLLIRLDVHDVDAIISFPGTSEKDKKREAEKEKDDGAKEGDKDAEKAKNEVTVDEGCWIYEQLRRLAQDLSHPLITTLQQECTRASCPEMKAGEWLYLCVAHGNDGAMEQCCAIDYILHTVDSATALLNSPRTFPSRLSIPQTSHRHFASLARRLGRIFAHAYFHHREAFEQAEAESSLYARFLALTEKFNLVPAEFLVIPSNNFAHEDAGPSREREQPLFDYNDAGRGGSYHPTNQQPQSQSQQGNADHFLASRGYRQHEYHGMEGEPRHPSSMSESSSGGSSTNGGIGETPNFSRSRFGRNRTDTMVFSDSEASAIADELAAKARAGQLEPEPHQLSNQSRSEAEDKSTEHEDEDDDEEGDLEGETQFEISLSPEEEIHGTYGEFTDPDHGEKEEEKSDAAPISQPITEPVPQHEEEPAEEEKPSHNVEEKVEESVVPEPVAEKESPVEQVSQPEEVASGEEETSEKVAESSTGEPVATPAAPSSTPDEAASETGPETSPEAPLVTSAQPAEESAHIGEPEVVEAVAPPSATEDSPPSISEVHGEVPAPSTEKQSSAVEPPSDHVPTPVSEATDDPVPVDEVSEGTIPEELLLEEIQIVEEAIGADSESLESGTTEEKTQEDKEAAIKSEDENVQTSLSTVSETDSGAIPASATTAEKEDQTASDPHPAP